MPSSSRSRLRFLPDLSFTLFGILLVVLFLAGGSSRADVWGQVVVRSAATLVLLTAIILGPKPNFSRYRFVLILLGCCAALPTFQLIPLPPTIWEALPGRTYFSQAATIIGEPQPWRPISLAPGATINALASLVVPSTMLVLLAQMTSDKRQWILGAVLSVIFLSLLVGLMQFSGLQVKSPFGDNGSINVNGFFDNRNHFAVLLAIGCVVAPAWALSRRRQKKWRAVVALGLLLLFLLMIMASGSRTGMAMGLLGTLLGIVNVQKEIRRELARYPRWLSLSTLAAIPVIVSVTILLSFRANRAVSINRILADDPAQDMRSKAFQTVAGLIETYFPVGTGFGSFDSIFRIHEPFSLLSPAYYNHAHNDFMEIVLDGGVAGLLLIVAALGWWLIRTFRVWTDSAEGNDALSRAGSASILLVMLASITDYPARTPMVMAILIILAAWLTAASPAADAPALPKHGHPL